MRKLWVALFILVLTAGFLGPSFAMQSGVRVLTPHGRSGLYMWSAETGQFLQIDRIVEGVRLAQNDLFRQVSELERRIKALERD